MPGGKSQSLRGAEEHGHEGCAMSPGHKQGHHSPLAKAVTCPCTLSMHILLLRHSAITALCASGERLAITGGL
jgi:hypothetical protein